MTRTDPQATPIEACIVGAVYLTVIVVILLVVL